MKTYRISWGDHTLELGRRTRIMGILNVTPDSFSDGGHFFKHDNAVAQGEKLAEAGADIIDIGGESTRPFSDPISDEEETRRVVPVIESLAKRVSVPISVDTTKAAVATRAIDAGASIINDISSLRVDPELADVVVKSDVPIILMHMKGTPETMQLAPVYDDLLGEIIAFFEKVMADAEARGISKSRVIIDPGIGFGKTVRDNLLLIRELGRLESLDVPILVGSSRKSFIRNILKDEDETDISPELPEVETGTQASVAASILNGAHIVRVHNVANTLTTVKIIDAIRES